MRKIKFRAWDKDEYKIIKWNDTFFSDMSPVTRWGSEFPDETYPIVLMQYTGLKDKNGKEIYEGDIVQEKWNNLLAGVEVVELYRVETADNSLIKMIHSSGQERWDRYLYLRNKNVEVIGNIYEMPDWDF